MYRQSLQVILYSFVVILCGCQNEQPEKTSVQQVETTTSEAASDTSNKIARMDGTKKSEDYWVIGLDADMSSGSARSGESIRRGLVLAIEEINQKGGLLGRPVKLEIRDHRGNPDRGVDNLEEFSEMDNLLAVVGGIHTPVALKELPIIHEKRLIYLSPWAAGTPIVDNDYEPNFVFRVSIRDEFAGGFLVQQAKKRNLKRMGLLLERTGWGRSNHKAISESLRQYGLEPAGVEWFNWGEKKINVQIEDLLKKNCDVILLVCNALEGTEIVNTLARLPKDKRIPVLSHWGISAGDFFQQTQDALKKVDVTFIQSFSFLNPNLNENAQNLAEQYVEKFDDSESPRDIFAPVGTAHAYEILQMFATAVQQANSGEKEKIITALESLGPYSGVIKNYSRPFRPEFHDALCVEDFILARFDEDGVIVLAE